MSVHDDRPVFRFAPSPNGHLHLGHAYSALINQHIADETGGRMLLRVEDIDTARCTPLLEAQMLEDLAWVGFSWEGEPRRQSDHFADYAHALDVLTDAGLAYASTLTRGDIRAIVEAHEASGEPWPRDPDGAPLFPGRAYETHATDADAPTVWRLDVAAAKAHLGVQTMRWEETGSGPEGQTGLVEGDPGAWGDFVLARRDTPTSYHLSVVVDDALQRITHVVRGGDLFHATAAHTLLQDVLGYQQPIYHHHDLVMDAHGARKLSKSARDTSLRSLREAGMTAADVKRMIGL
ncbi:MAG: tRNA glutamyl-Q(34) synthetase GluQRS [Pseudomonadota bacterium]